MRERGRQVIAEFTPEDLLQFSTVKNGLWHVDCAGLPDDLRVISMEFNAARQILKVVLETDTPRGEFSDGFFEIARYSEAPILDLFRKVEFLGSLDSRPSPQCAPKRGSVVIDSRHSYTVE